MAEETQVELIRKRTVVLRLPAMDAVSVRRDVECRTAAGESVLLDLYYPPHQESRAGLPVLVFVMGYPDAGMKAIMGCSAKEVGQYTSWARLAAASGMVGVTYSADEPASGTIAVLRHLRDNARALNLDAARVGIWSCSGNVPNALGVLMDEAPGSIRCAVLCYGLMLDLGGSTFVAEARKMWRFVTPAAGKSVSDLPPTVPLLVARAGKDEFPHLNDTIDRFVASALELDLPLTVVNHRGAPHAFDVLLDDEPTREIIRQMLAFLRFNLSR
jgi:acetyl esterase/lipase